MSNDDDRRPRRDPGRPEDNPFIAFRRFADSQVSSLLNTVFTLPATIANYNNAHQAREQCLFGRADERQCNKLQELEAEITDLRHEGRELFRVGDVQAVLRNSKTLMKLDRRADEIRKDIIEDASSAGKNDQTMSRRNEAEMVEKVAMQKGRDWGGSWDWGFPRPFDNEQRNLAGTSEEEVAREMQELETLLRLQSEVQKLVAAFDGDAWDDPPAPAAKYNIEFETPSDSETSHGWSWSRDWEWPRPADASWKDEHAYSPHVLDKVHKMKAIGIPWTQAYAELLRADRTEQPHDEPSYEYSHDHEDQHNEPPSPRSSPLFPSVDRLSDEEYERTSHDDPLTKKFFELRQQRKRDYMAQLDEDAKAHVTARSSAYPDEYYKQSEEETEMDAYEHLEVGCQVARPSDPPIGLDTTSHTTPSILSTLTTTQRMVAPDGSVTTKVVLKKRFADGREESSETVHIQRGHESEVRPDLPSTAMLRPVEVVPEEKQAKYHNTGKRNGWFWSN